MTKFVFSFAGRERDRKLVEYETVEAARNEAVRHLGTYLSDHPGFADEGHWRVNVESEFGEPILHVIVATVSARKRDT